MSKPLSIISLGKLTIPIIKCLKEKTRSYYQHTLIKLLTEHGNQGRRNRDGGLGEL